MKIYRTIDLNQRNFLHRIKITYLPVWVNQLYSFFIGNNCRNRAKSFLIIPRRQSRAFFSLSFFSLNEKKQKSRLCDAVRSDEIAVQHAARHTVKSTLKNYYFNKLFAIKLAFMF